MHRRIIDNLPHHHHVVHFATTGNHLPQDWDWNSVNQHYIHACHLLMDMCLKSGTHSHTLVETLWKSCIYPLIDLYRSRLALTVHNPSDVTSSLPGFFQQFLTPVIQAYEQFIRDFQLTFHLHFPLTKSNVLSRTYQHHFITWHHLHVHLGDLYRYAHSTPTSTLTSTSTIPNPCIEWYEKASLLLPNNGRVYHHLARIHQSQSHLIPTAYFYYRSRSVKTAYVSREAFLTFLSDEGRVSSASTGSARSGDARLRALVEELLGVCRVTAALYHRIATAVHEKSPLRRPTWLDRHMMERIVLSVHFKLFAKVDVDTLELGPYLLVLSLLDGDDEFHFYSTMCNLAAFEQCEGLQKHTLTLILLSAKLNLVKNRRWLVAITLAFLISNTQALTHHINTWKRTDDPVLHLLALFLADICDDYNHHQHPMLLPIRDRKLSAPALPFEWLCRGFQPLKHVYGHPTLTLFVGDNERRIGMDLDSRSATSTSQLVKSRDADDSRLKARLSELWGMLATRTTWVSVKKGQWVPCDEFLEVANRVKLLQMPMTITLSGGGDTMSRTQSRTRAWKHIMMDEENDGGSDLDTLKQHKHANLLDTLIPSTSPPSDLNIHKDRTVLVFDTNIYLGRGLLDIQRIIEQREFFISVPLIVLNEIEGLSQTHTRAKQALEFLIAHFDLVDRDKSCPIRAQTNQGTFLSSLYFRHQCTDGSLSDTGAMSNDDLILSCCLSVVDNPPPGRRVGPGLPVLLVTNDVNLRVKARAVDIQVVDLDDFRRLVKLT